MESYKDLCLDRVELIDESSITLPKLEYINVKLGNVNFKYLVDIMGEDSLRVVLISCEDITTIPHNNIVLVIRLTKSSTHFT